MSIPAVSPPLPGDGVPLGGIASRTGQQTNTTPTKATGEPPRAEPVKAAAEPTASQAVQLEDVELAMDEVRKAITPVAQDLLFSIEEDTGKTIVKVVDATTDEVIRQIPSEEIINIAKALDKLQGLLLQQKA